MDASRVILIAVLGLSLVVGVSFVRQAFAGKAAPARGMSKVRKFSKEVQFRLRLAAGAGLLVWVLSGLVWLVINWR